MFYFLIGCISLSLLIVGATYAYFTASTKDDTNYGTFYVYPWQRNTVGGEGPESVILSKKYFNT